MEQPQELIAPGSVYLLPHDEGERLRLQRQHTYLIRTVCDGRLVYDKSIVFTRDSIILDAGTGTGAWSMELADELPGYVHIVAIDVSNELFPDKYPENISFQQHSVTQLPAAWTGRFHFVHQRLLTVALRVAEWPTAIAEIFRVLEPGGAVQLIELDFPSWPKASKADKMRDEITEILTKNKGLMYDCASRLPQMVRKAGFVDIRTETKLMPVGRNSGEYGPLGRDSFVGAFRAMKQRFIEANGFRYVQSEVEYEQIMDALAKEWDEERSGQYLPAILVCAKKPTF